MLASLSTTEHLGKSDHIVLNFEYCFQLQVPLATYIQYLYDKGDYESINEELLHEHWTVLFQDLSISGMWEVFHSKLLYLMDKYIPSVNISSAKQGPIHYGLIKKFKGLLSQNTKLGTNIYLHDKSLITMLIQK